MVLVVFEIANRVFFIVFVNAHLDILSLHIPDEPIFLLYSSQICTYLGTVGLHWSQAACFLFQQAYNSEFLSKFAKKIKDETYI